jgi:L-2,4-diaminobutyric acid acetyltransferase
MYCNLLQCTHFSSTSVAAIQDDELVGFISGYVIPERENTLFIWQVAVNDKARGQGLAARMLKNILDRSLCKEVNYLETTITESNQASWALFKSLAKKLNSELNASVMFDCDRHFSGEHDTELLARIGPFNYHATA